MIGLDTNVLVRYLAQDDPRQSALATRLMEGLSVSAPGYVSQVSLVELVWVLTSCYRLPKAELVALLETLLRSQELVIERADLAWKALHRFSVANADFADCLIERSADSAGCEKVMTFDAKAARTAGMHLLEG
ncbi:PIN domain-containing protein [Pseudomonas sp. No.21]|uniref:PIN domain-containing protein n=1 Tax=Pseudomonas TaxID=286 RepID=UPI000DA9D251|nr:MULTISPECIES: type II toxin-antitoxin system VapC family toxin [Pseudomonas]MDW3716388.1 type II toxin-antitoxin system VapC family toxin [Pseudomonas sp. 2023EL-01195]PZE11633.1 VapC toxin family PIN domain ribonuclease [Pseudomonas sp. 57B-090624]GJN48869.1 hypothetical protein TUM20249_48550 [Pseudomonas tohonis]